MQRDLELGERREHVAAALAVERRARVHDVGNDRERVTGVVRELDRPIKARVAIVDE